MSEFPNCHCPSCTRLCDMGYLREGIKAQDEKLRKAIQLLQDYKRILDNIIIEPNSPIHERTIRLLKELEGE